MTDNELILKTAIHLQCALDEKVGRLSDIEFHEFINIEE
jgi:hypothetical protein